MAHPTTIWAGLVGLCHHRECDMSTNDACLKQIDAATLIEEACARNSPIEIHFIAPDGETHVAKSRCLDLDENYLYLEDPQSIGHPLELRPRQKIQGHLFLHEVRYTFRTAVIDPKQLVQLNKKMQVVGIVVRRPLELIDGQRRAYYRVSLLGSSPIEASMHAAPAGRVDVVSIDAIRFDASFVNVSLGGAALTVDIEAGRQCRLDDSMFIQFYLPDEEEEYVFLSEVRQMRKIAGGTMIRFGIQFTAWPSVIHLRRARQRLQKRITQFQREQLQKSA